MKLILVKREHYQQALERFDAENAVDCRIAIPCPACEEFGATCHGCPFRERYGVRRGCTAFLDEVGVSDEDRQAVVVCKGAVYWDAADDAAARAVVGKIRRALAENLTYAGRLRRER